MLSKLFAAGLLHRHSRGEYTFTVAAAELISQPIPVAVEPWERGGEEPLQILILTPEELIAFNSLNRCQPKTVVVPFAKKRDRITESDLDTLHLDSEGREKFLWKMEEAGILQADGEGKKGRIFHFNAERYLELCDKVQVVAPVQWKLNELKVTLSDRKQLLENWTEAETTLASELKADKERLADLQNQLAEIQKKIEVVSVDIRAGRQKLEAARQQIASSGYVGEIKELENLISVLEPMSGLSEALQAKLLRLLGLKIS